jgi:hypothetical protein
MKNDTLLTVTSLLSIVLMTFHLTDDVVRGFEPGELKNLTAIAILVVWAVAALLLVGRRSATSSCCSVRSGRSHSGLAHVGDRRRRDRGVTRRLLLRLDAVRARRNRDLLAEPLGARAVERATAAARWSREGTQRLGSGKDARGRGADPRPLSAH